VKKKRQHEDTKVRSITFVNASAAKQPWYLTSIGFVFFVSSCCFSFVVAAQEPLPRFRSGANLVNVDAYFSKDGKAVTDLKQDEIEILEDNKPQTIEAFRLIAARAQSTPAAAASGGKPAIIPQPAERHSRTFVLFFDTWHVSRDGSRKAASPVSELLNRIVGVDDRIGVMTPDITARSMDLTSRTSAIERMVRESTQWGLRDTVGDGDPREHEIALCYPENDIQKPQFRGIAKAMIERRREQKTMRALDELIAHLASLGDERKFVVLLTEGWVLFRQDESLARVLEKDSIPHEPAPGSGSQGLRRPDAYDRGFASCERERSMLAFVDHALEVRQLAQRANRANVTFYAIDPRGLAAFDDSIGPLRPATPSEDLSRMASRQGGLRELAGNTDGAVVLNTNDTKGGVARMMADLGSYYVLQYYSTNTKLDGRFRSIAVRVKRPGVQVRARNGYLAPTEAEARTVSTKTPALPAGVTAIRRRAPVVALRRGPSTGRDYVRAEQPQFRRTERLRIEVVLPAGAANVTGHVLTSVGQPLPLPVTASTAQTNGETVHVAEVALAPLAAASYVLQLSYDVDGKKETVDYEFKIIP
jgi:VWFA-related protein